MFVDIFYSLSFETQIFLVTITLFTLVFHATYTPSTAEKAPAFLTTLGIFGTFVGIAIGLLEFNTIDISGSVPKLIEGIKTAVWASAAGIFAALTVKLRDIEGFSKRKRPEKKATIEDLISALKAMEAALKEHAASAPLPVAAEVVVQQSAPVQATVIEAPASVIASVQPLAEKEEPKVNRPIIKKPTEEELSAVRRDLPEEFKTGTLKEMPVELPRKAAARKPEFEFKDGSHFEETITPSSKTSQF